MPNPQLTHNGQPVNLDAILDLAAAAGTLLEDKADWVDAILEARRNITPNDQAFLAERLEGG